jgi:RNA polymerase sigma-70 factor (ECF subfamily)
MHPTDEDPDRVFEALVNAYYRPLYQFAFSLVHREDEASDLTQQTYLLWASKGHTLRDPSKAKTWLFTTLYREFLKTRRHETAFPHRTLDEENDHMPALPAPTLERLDSAAVLEALATIEEIYRAPLELFYVGEHSYREISEILSVPIGTVQSRICRGKAQLREVLTRSTKSADGKGRVTFG